MKKLTRYLLILLVLIACSGVGGYFYFRKSFSAPPNQLSVLPNGEWIPFSWSGGNDVGNPDSLEALLVPVELKNHPGQFWMQFDLGASITVLYSGKMASLHARDGGVVIRTRENRKYIDNTSMQIGSQPILARTLRVYKTTGPIHWNKPDEQQIIGTLGSDFIDGRVLVIDYPNKRLALYRQLPADIAVRFSFSPLKFKERRLLIPFTMNGKASDLMFDTGSSAYSLLTSQSSWKSLARPGAVATRSGINSWGNTLYVNEIATDASIEIGATDFKLGEVAYVEGTSLTQDWMMRLSGMGGMTGNRLFLNKMIVVDTREARFGISK
ncbi:MAG: hypothetical protein ACREPB_15100 [Arenimonas sp.]